VEQVHVVGGGSQGGPQGGLQLVASAGRRGSSSRCTSACFYFCGQITFLHAVSRITPALLTTIPLTNSHDLSLEMCPKMRALALRGSGDGQKRGLDATKLSLSSTILRQWSPLRQRVVTRRETVLSMTAFINLREA